MDELLPTAVAERLHAVPDWSGDDRCHFLPGLEPGVDGLLALLELGWRHGFCSNLRLFV